MNLEFIDWNTVYWVFLKGFVLWLAWDLRKFLKASRRTEPTIEHLLELLKKLRDFSTEDFGNTNRKGNTKGF